MLFVLLLCAYFERIDRKQTKRKKGLQYTHHSSSCSLLGGSGKKISPSAAAGKEKRKKNVDCFLQVICYFTFLGYDVLLAVVAFYFCGAAAALHSRVRAVSFFNGRTNG